MFSEKTLNESVLCLNFTELEKIEKGGVRMKDYRDIENTRYIIRYICVTVHERLRMCLKPNGRTVYTAPVRLTATEKRTEIKISLFPMKLPRRL